MADCLGVAGRLHVQWGLLDAALARAATVK